MTLHNPSILSQSLARTTDLLGDQVSKRVIRVMSWRSCARKKHAWARRLKRAFHGISGHTALVGAGEASNVSTCAATYVCETEAVKVVPARDQGESGWSFRNLDTTFVTLAQVLVFNNAYADSVGGVDVTEPLRFRVVD